MHFYGWKNGLKTGMYYLRSRPAADAIQFTVDVEALLKDCGQIDIPHDNEEKENKGGENVGDNILKKVKKNDENVNIKKFNTVCGDEVCFSCGS